MRQEVDRDRAGVRPRRPRPGWIERGQLLLHLGHVAVAADAVGLDALVDLGEREIRLGLAAGARDAALRVDDEVADQPRPGEGSKGEDRRGRVAAGRADDRGLGVDERLQLGAVQLRQPVDGGRSSSGAGCSK